MSADQPRDESIQLPAQMRGQIISDLANSIEPTLPEGLPDRVAVAESAAESALSEIIEKGGISVGSIEEASFSMLHVGPVPPVPMVRGYNDIYPGAAQTMFEMAVRDQTAVIESRKDKAARDDRFRIISIVLGFLALLALLAFSLAAAMNGHEKVALGMLALGVGGIIATFVGAPHLLPKRAKSEPEKEPASNAPPAQVDKKAADER